MPAVSLGCPALVLTYKLVNSDSTSYLGSDILLEGGTGDMLIYTTVSRI